MERKVTQPERVLRLAGEKGVLRASDLTPERLPRQSLRRLRDQGRLVQVARGLYSLPNAPLTEHHSLAEVARRVPQGVICLLSALRFHDLTTQEPHEV